MFTVALNSVHAVCCSDTVYNDPRESEAYVYAKTLQSTQSTYVFIRVLLNAKLVYNNKYIQYKMYKPCAIFPDIHISPTYSPIFVRECDYMSYIFICAQIGKSWKR